jgi:hypothetical protein
MMFRITPPAYFPGPKFKALFRFFPRLHFLKFYGGYFIPPESTVGGLARRAKAAALPPNFR